MSDTALPLGLRWPDGERLAGSVALSTVATANHYVFDVAAGLAITAVGYVVALRPRVRLARREQLAVAT